MYSNSAEKVFFGASLLTLLFLAGITYWPWITGAEGFTRPGEDSHRQILPWLIFAKRQWLSGYVPFINFYQQCGFDFFSAGFTGVIDPYTFLLSLAPDDVFVLAFFHVFLIKGIVFFIGHYLCMQIVTRESGGRIVRLSVIGVMSFFLSTLLARQGAHFFTASAISWLPLAVALMYYAFHGSNYAALILPFVLAAMTFSGHFQFLIYIYTLLGTLFLTLVFVSTDPPFDLKGRWLRRVSIPSISCAIGALLSMPLLIPALLNLRLVPRSLRIQSTAPELLNLARLLNPNIVGLPTRSEHNWFGPGLNYYEAFNGFTSAVAVIFFLALVHVRYKHWLYTFWQWVFVVFVIIAIKASPRALFDSLFGVSNVNRAGFLAGIPLSLALSYGMYLLIAGKNEKCRQLLRWLMRYAALILAFLSCLSIPEVLDGIFTYYNIAKQHSFYVQKELSFAWLTILFFLLGVWWCAARANWNWVVAGLVAVVVGVEIFHHSGRVMETTWAGVYGPSISDAFQHVRTKIIPQQIDALGLRETQGRILAPTVSADWNTYHKIEDPQIYSSITNKYYGELVKGMDNFVPQGTGLEGIDRAPNYAYATFRSWLPSYSGMGVRYFAIPPKYSGHMNPIATNANIALYSLLNHNGTKHPEVPIEFPENTFNIDSAEVQVLPGTSLSFTISRPETAQSLVRARARDPQKTMRGILTISVQDDVYQILSQTAVELRDVLNTKQIVPHLPNRSRSKLHVTVNLSPDATNIVLLSFENFGRLIQEDMHQIAYMPWGSWAGEIYENKSFDGMAYLRNAAVVIPENAASVIASIYSLAHPELPVVLASQPDEWFGEVDASTSKKGASLQQVPNGLRVQVSTDKRRILVLPYTWYPGWKAYVNGNPAKIYRAQHAFMAIPLEMGNHTVALQYLPAGLAQAFLLACFGGVIWLLLLAAIIGGSMRRART